MSETPNAKKRVRHKEGIPLDLTTWQERLAAARKLEPSHENHGLASQWLMAESFGYRHLAITRPSTRSRSTTCCPGRWIVRD